MSATGEGAAAEPSSEAEAIKWGDWCYDVHLIDPAEAVLAAAEKGINDVNARELGYADAKDFTLHVKQLRRVVAAEVKRRIKFVEGSGAREARQETFANIKEKIESIPIGLLNVAKRLGNLVIDRALRPVETSKAAARAVARVPGRVEKWSDRTVDGFGKAWPSGVPPHL
jgi:hypothetical protein